MHLYIFILFILKVYTQTCNVILPKDPLTAKGLSTPYIYHGIGCDETNSNSSSFVEALILNKKTGDLVAYSPLIINNDTQVLFPLIVPNVTKDHIIGLWFGSNANILILKDPDNSKTLKDYNCVNGKIPGDFFGQVSGCNNINFFK